MADTPHSLFPGWVTHRRLEPFVHAFRYNLFLTEIDLDVREGWRRVE